MQQGDARRSRATCSGPSLKELFSNPPPKPHWFWASRMLTGQWQMCSRDNSLLCCCTQFAAVVTALKIKSGTFMFVHHRLYVCVSLGPDNVLGDWGWSSSPQTHPHRTVEFYMEFTHFCYLLVPVRV
ncbi:hypothetical protein GN956_G6831 [Arapaima gigas]